MKHIIAKRWRRIGWQCVGATAGISLFEVGLIIPIHSLGFLFCFSGICGVIVCAAFFVNEL